MVVKPHLQPRVFGRKKEKRQPYAKELLRRSFWKERWEIERMAPMPIGNPWSRQPLDYYLKKEMWKRKRSYRFQPVESIYTTSGDRVPDISRRLLVKTLGRRVAMLHPIGMAVSIAADAKDIYNLLN